MRGTWSGSSLASVVAALLSFLASASSAAQGLVAQGPEFQVNTYTTGDQSDPVTAALANGDFVVVWSGGAGAGAIEGRRYDSNGSPIGGEFAINSDTTHAGVEPSAAALPNGNFVVVWAGGSSGTDTELSIQGRRFASSGTPLGGEFQVNTYTTGYQRKPSVAADSVGDFVVVWESNGSSGGDTSGYSILAQRYASSGTPVGSQFQVNTYTTNSQAFPSVAAAADGDFLVVWHSDGSAGGDASLTSIQGQRYASNGSAQGSQFQVNTYTTSYQLGPSVASKTNGDFVVVWGSLGSSGTDSDGESIQGQRYASDGTPVGGEFQINTYTTGLQAAPFVTSDATGDAFVVVWASSSSGSEFDTRGQRYTWNGAPDGEEFQVNSFTYAPSPLRATDPSVAVDAMGDVMVAWQSAGSSGSDTSNFSIQARRFESIALGTQFQVNSYTPSYQRDAAAASDAAGDFVVVWESDGSSGGDTSYESIQGQRYDSSGAAQGAQFQVNSYTLYNQSRPSVASDAEGDFVVVWEGSSASDPNGGIRGQRYTSMGSTAGSEFQVNSYTTNTQYTPAVAAEANGDFVVVWMSSGSSGTDPFGRSIQGQRYASSGTAIGSQFQVNSYTTSDQSLPAVASDADGDFVVVWQSNGSSGSDTSFYSIQGQRYASNGTAQGSQFQVNSYTTDFQGYPGVAADAAGDFVVAWQSNGSPSDANLGIRAQRYASNGAAQGGEFQVNTYTSDSQVRPSVVSDPAGNFAVTWQSAKSFGSDTDSDSIQGQRYDSNGTPIGGEFQVNSYTTYVQRKPAVAADAGGSFVVVWESRGSFGTDSSNYSIQGQRYLPEPESTLGMAAGVGLLLGLRARDVTRMRRRPRAG